MSDVILESIRASIMGVILAYLWWIGNKEQLHRQRGWWFIFAGFVLIFLGSVVDITDNYDSLNKYVIVGDTAYEAFLEKVAGNLVGAVLLLIGLWYWLPLVAALRKAEHDLSRYNQELEATVDVRTDDLRHANRLLQQEIEERIRGEKALRESEVSNRVLLNSIPDLILRIRRDGTLLDYKGAKDQTHLAMFSKEPLGKNIRDLMPPQFARMVTQHLERALDAGEEQIFEHQLPMPPDGRNSHDYEVRVDVSGQDEVLAIVRDITEHRKVDRMKDEFFSVVSHELRTPSLPCAAP